MTDSSNKNIQINEIESQQISREFFNCDLFDTLPYFKDDMASMEHPVFSLTTHADKRLLRYEHNGNTITIKPGYDGLPTIHDKDVLIYCTSHLRAAITQRQNSKSHGTVYSLRFLCFHRPGHRW